MLQKLMIKRPINSYGGIEDQCEGLTVLKVAL